jgi:hypothetical protein
MVYDGNRAFEVSRIFGHHGSTNGDGRACKFPKFVDVGETTAEGCVTTRDRLSCEATFGFKADPFKNKCNDMPRLYVITATAEPTAVILRRGPSRWYHVIQWDMHRDEFVHGAWVKGRIYEEKCDVSPDGRLLLYFIHQGNRVRTEFTDSWTAISRVPWLQALVVWPQGQTYGGGGRFVDDTSIALRGIHSSPLDEFPANGIKVTSNNWETPVHHPTDDVPDADWCGRDHKDRIIFSRGGSLFRRIKDKDMLIADFTDLTPSPQAAPDWAGKPLAQASSKQTGKRSRRSRGS